MPTFHCSAILFDLDGVLIDSTASITRRWAKWAEQQGLDPLEVLEVIHGRRSAEVIRLVAPHLDVVAEGTQKRYLHSVFNAVALHHAA